MTTPTVDDIIANLELRGLGWSLHHIGTLIEALVWDCPHVIGRYRPATVEPLAKMLATACIELDWTKYPVKALAHARAYTNPTYASPASASATCATS